MLSVNLFAEKNKGVKVNRGDKLPAWFLTVKQNACCEKYSEKTLKIDALVLPRKLIKIIPYISEAVLILIYRNGMALLKTKVFEPGTWAGTSLFKKVLFFPFFSRIPVRSAATSFYSPFHSIVCAPTPAALHPVQGNSLWNELDTS